MKLPDSLRTKQGLFISQYPLQEIELQEQVLEFGKKIRDNQY